MSEKKLLMRTTAGKLMAESETGKLMVQSKCPPSVWRLDESGNYIDSIGILRGTSNCFTPYRIDAEENVVAVFRDYSSGMPPYPFYIRKWTWGLEKVWDNDWDEGWNEVHDVANDSENHIIVIGVKNWVNTIEEFDADGDSLWSATLPQYGQAVTVDSSNNIYVACTRYVRKYNSAGTVQWTYDGGSGNPGFRKIGIDVNCSVYVFAGEEVRKLNDDGVLQWSFSCCDVPPEEWGLDDLAVTSDGDVVVGGATSYWDDYLQATYGTPTLIEVGWSYDVGDYGQPEEDLKSSDPVYCCTQAHTCTVDTLPPDGADWEDYWEVNTKRNLWKIKGTGVLDWGNYFNCNIRAIAVDSSEAVYLACIRKDSKTVRKINSTGTSEVWSFDTGPGGTSYGANGILWKDSKLIVSSYHYGWPG